MRALANPVRPARRRGSLTAAVLRWPLVCVNRLFDWGLGCLGPLGRPLRGDRGRNLLGWTGVVLLAGAVAWLLLGGTPWTR
jgi:hypothetical protein